MTVLRHINHVTYSRIYHHGMINDQSFIQKQDTIDRIIGIAYLSGVPLMTAHKELIKVTGR